VTSTQPAEASMSAKRTYAMCSRVFMDSMVMLVGWLRLD
jgi:hypothetical protein